MRLPIHHCDLHHEPEDRHVGIYALWLSKNTNRVRAIHANIPTSKAAIEMVSARMAAMTPLPNDNPRIGAIVKYWEEDTERVGKKEIQNELGAKLRSSGEAGN